MTLFADWLAETKQLQVDAYGGAPDAFTGDQRAQYFSEMGFAAVVELAEMSQEIGWKSWGTDRTINRDNYLKEGVDVLHFVANLLVLGGITDEQLNAAYEAKMAVNRERMLSGKYDGRIENKCIDCKRSFDDIARSAFNTEYCIICKGEMF